MCNVHTTGGKSRKSNGSARPATAIESANATHWGDGAIYRIPKHLRNAVHTVEISGFS